VITSGPINVIEIKPYSPLLGSFKSILERVFIITYIYIYIYYSSYFLQLLDITKIEETIIPQSSFQPFKPSAIRFDSFFFFRLFVFFRLSVVKLFLDIYNTNNSFKSSLAITEGLIEAF
jgi:hypothetical protein